MSGIERLVNRWNTPAGRTAIEEVVRDLHDGGGMNMPAILEQVAHTQEVPEGLDLRYAPLEGRQLDEVNLYAVDLTGARLGRVSLQGADLRDGHLVGADLTGARLTGSFLTNNDLSGANLRDAVLDECSLDGVLLRGAVCVGASCQRAYMAGAVLDRADMRKVRFTEADLSDATVVATKISAGAFRDVAVLPPDRSRLLVELPPGTRRPGASQHMRRTARGGPSGSGALALQSGGGRRDPARAQSGKLRAPSAGNPTGRAARAAGGNDARPNPLHDWDQAMSRLFPLRKRVNRITIRIGDTEQVIFEGRP
ncbi:MAG: pentapeptide repeat-containing protein [Planctomycetota bacterium]